MSEIKKGFSDKQFFIPNVRTNLIKQMISDNNISQNELAEYLNCNLSSLRNKFSRDAFSLYDFIITCYVCNYSLCICDPRISECINATKKGVEEIIHNLGTIDSENMLNNIDDSIDVAEDIFIQFEEMENQEFIFNFSPENILSDDECNRIKSIQDNKEDEKLKEIVDKIPSKDLKKVLALLKERFPDSN